MIRLETKFVEQSKVYFAVRNVPLQNRIAIEVKPRKIKWCVGTFRPLQVLVVGGSNFTNLGLTRLVNHWGHEACGMIFPRLMPNSIDTKLPDVVLMNHELALVDVCYLGRQIKRDIKFSNCLMIAIRDESTGVAKKEIERAGIDILLEMPVDSNVVKTLLLLECTHVNRRNMVNPARPL